MTKDKALRLALEALEFANVNYWWGSSNIEQAITAIKVALEEEDEPVAWMFQHEETGRTMCVDAQQLEWGFEKGNPRLKKIAPLYTTPPQRTWVGLTDEEKQEIYKQADEENWHDQPLLETVEAKLKEKNI